MLATAVHALRIPVDTAVRIGMSQRVEIAFDEMEFIWINGNEELFPEVLIPIEFNGWKYEWTESRELTILNRFLSRLAARISEPMQIHRFHRYVVRLDCQWDQLSRKASECVVDQASLPTASGESPRENLAVALYRESISASSVYYAFLCLFKIVELGHDQYSDRERASHVIGYIDSNMSAARTAFPTHPAGPPVGVEALTGQSLYKTFRCAIAHASMRQMRSPDEITDYYATSSAIGIMQSIAMFMVNSGHFANQA